MEWSAAAIAAAEAAGSDAANNAIVDLLDAGASPGYVEIRDGTQPADPDTAATGTVLATLTCSATAFGNSTAGVATANSLTPDSNAVGGSSATWFRAYDGDDTPVIDGDVGIAGSGADMEIDAASTAIGAGDTVAVTLWTHSMTATATAT